MNIRPLLLILLPALLTAAPAQPPHARSGPGERSAPPESLRVDRDRHQPVIERWLRHLETEDPAEHRRLNELREENPAAFREALRRHFAEARQSPLARRGGRMLPPELSAPIDALRRAETEDERRQAREALRRALAEQIDQRLAQREQRIQTIREELGQLETRHQTDKARRDRWIEETLEKLLEP